MRLVFDIGQILLQFPSLKLSVNCLHMKDKIFAPMDDDRPCYQVRRHFMVLKTENNRNPSTQIPQQSFGN